MDVGRFNEPRGMQSRREFDSRKSVRRAGFRVDKRPALMIVRESGAPTFRSTLGGGESEREREGPVPTSFHRSLMAFHSRIPAIESFNKINILGARR